MTAQNLDEVFYQTDSETRDADLAEQLNAVFKSLNIKLYCAASPVLRGQDDSMASLIFRTDKPFDKKNLRSIENRILNNTLGPDIDFDYSIQDVKQLIK